MRFSTRWTTLVAAVLVLACTGTCSPTVRASDEERLTPDAAEEVFARGVEAYEDGRYGEASAHFAKLVENGLVHEDVLYNLGCARAREGRLGAALLAFRQALFIDPAHDDARANAAWVHERLGAPPSIDSPLREALARTLDVLRVDLLAAVFVVLWLAGALVAGRAVVLAVLGRPARFGFALAILGASALVALPLGARLALLESEDRGVVVASRAEARSGPGATNPALFTVPEGSEVRLLDARGGFVRVAVPDGPLGWVPCSDLGAVDAARRVCAGEALP